MKSPIIIVAALAALGFVTTPCKAETNTIHVAGLEIPVRFPESDLDSSRRELIRQDTERYFKQVDQLLSAAERRRLFRRYEEGSFRTPSTDEASDEEVVVALSDIASRFDFSGACLLELEQSSEAPCWMIPLRYGFAAGTNDFEKAILSAPAVFVDGFWGLIF